MEEPQPWPQILSPRRTNSPEFEFWMVRNPNLPQPNLLSADQLFSDGFLLPLHLLRLSDNPPPQQDPLPHPGPNSINVDSPDHLLVAAPNLTNYKRWRRIFKKNVKKCTDGSVAGGDDQCGKDARVLIKEKRREKKGGGANSMVSAAELNINIWPFSRSRSAGNSGNRPRSAAPPRKVSSAPCSRSNSAGESKSKRWANSPARPGVHLGRTSPVWQVRRPGGRGSDTTVKNNPRKDAIDSRRKIPAATKAKVLSLNVPMCIGYRQNLGCRSDENGPAGVVADYDGGGVSGEGLRRSNLFNIRSLFSRKVY